MCCHVKNIANNLGGEGTLQKIVCILANILLTEHFFNNLHVRWAQEGCTS